jgi:hypothetical protein
MTKVDQKVFFIVLCFSLAVMLYIQYRKNAAKASQTVMLSSGLTAKKIVPFEEGPHTLTRF